MRAPHLQLRWSPIYLLSSNITHLSFHTGSVGIRARVFDKGWSRYLPKTLESLNLCILHLPLDETWADQLHAPLLRRIEISLIRDPFDRPTEVSIVQLLMKLQCPLLESVPPIREISSRECLQI
jgi:hypothetical protein